MAPSRHWYRPRRASSSPAAEATTSSVPPSCALASETSTASRSGRDVVDVEGWRYWWQQITETIDHVEYLILVITPNALRAKVARDDWHRGRQQAPVGSMLEILLLTTRAVGPRFFASLRRPAFARAPRPVPLE